MSRATADERARLRILLGIVFAALLIPAVVLAWLGYRQLQFEAFYLQQTKAQDLTVRIDRRVAEIFSAEDARSFVDFGFLIVGEGNYLQRSPLSGYPVNGDIPGLVSYFQVDAEGSFSTPLLPDDGDIGAMDPAEYLARQALQDHTRALLAGSPIPASTSEQAPGRTPVQTSARSRAGDSPQAPARQAFSDSAGGTERQRDDGAAGELEMASSSRDQSYRLQAELLEGQRAYERLNAPKAKTDSPLGRVSELQLKESFVQPLAPEPSAAQSAPAMDALEEVVLEAGIAEGKKSELRPRRMERNLSPSPNPADLVSSDPDEAVAQPLTLFESEVDPFRFDVLDADHFVLHRSAWHDQQRYVQGAIIERNTFHALLFDPAYRDSGLGSTGSLVVAHNGEVMATSVGPPASRESYLQLMPKAAEISGTLLYRSRLTAPVNDIELIFGFSELPTGPGASLIGWTTFAFLLMLVGGFWLLQRLGLRQITLGEQQQDFVSAVSHELKTPLTSIRMYGEILKAGWASEEKRQEYYEFIFSESERLTRLINNVLRLARFDRNGSDLDLKTTTVGELTDLSRSKIASQIDQAGFVLEEAHENPSLELLADADAFVQIVINLVDNALKFSAGADENKIVFGSRREGDQIEFSVRDFGPGVPKPQMKKIFQLFYRAERELTRETVGTGIGLALVHELAAAMGGSVDVRNLEPGAEFLVRLPTGRT